MYNLEVWFCDKICYTFVSSVLFLNKVEYVNYISRPLNEIFKINRMVLNSPNLISVRWLGVDELIEAVHRILHGTEQLLIYFSIISEFSIHALDTALLAFHRFSCEDSIMMYVRNCIIWAILRYPRKW